MDKPTPNEPGINNEPGVKNESGYMVDVMIPPECLDDAGECEHSKKEDKREYNPV